MAKRKLDARAFAQQKRKRRQWLTFVRMCRYGINNFSRNAWLTIAATAVMTITLLIIFATFAARSILVDSVDQIRQKVDISIYLKTDASKKDIDTIVSKIQALPSVKKAEPQSPDAARTTVAQQNSSNQDILSALNEATNKLPWTVKVNLTDINNTTELQQLVEKDATIKKNLDAELPPSYSGDKKDAINNISKAVDFAQKFGSVASVIFIVISSLIIFNTIRMAIFNRKDEIQMMKLIGADKNFIRGPFIVEAVVYGFIAAVLATVLGVSALYALKPKLATSGLVIEHTVNQMTLYIGFVLILMIALGALIGVVSSLLATRRYLKI